MSFQQEVLICLLHTLQNSPTGVPDLRQGGGTAGEGKVPWHTEAPIQPGTFLFLNNCFSFFSSVHERKLLEQTLKPSTCRCWENFGPPCPRRRRRITRGRRKDKKGRNTNGKLRTAMLRTLEGWMWMMWRMRQNHREIFLINQTENQNL